MCTEHRLVYTIQKMFVEVTLRCQTAYHIDKLFSSRISSVRLRQSIIISQNIEYNDHITFALTSLPSHIPFHRLCNFIAYLERKINKRNSKKKRKNKKTQRSGTQYECNGKNEPPPTSPLPLLPPSRCK